MARVKRRVLPRCPSCQAVTNGVRFGGGVMRCGYCLVPLGNSIPPPQPKKKPVKVKSCPTCMARSGWFDHPEKGPICTICATPQSHATGKPKQGKGYGASIARRVDRERAREDSTLTDHEYSSCQPGYPLGRGMPSGSPLRNDGESHREAWIRVIRADSCSYCDAPVSGTVDHIEPQSGPRPPYGLHTWINYTGACENCNGAKSNRSLLVFLAQRGIVSRRVPSLASLAKR